MVTLPIQALSDWFDGIQIRRTNWEKHEVNAKLMSPPTRVLTRVREVIVRDEQNPLSGILLANTIETLADSFFV